MVGKGPSARTLSLDLPPFTLIAATTRENLLSQPLRSRFGATLKPHCQQQREHNRIIHRAAKSKDIEPTADAVEIIAGASRGTPRAANRLLKRARDFAQVRAKSIIDEAAARDTLAMLEVDEAGLEPQDRRLLMTIIEKFNGGPVGVNTLAAALSEDRGVIEEIYEPYLMTLGFLQRSSAGRIVLPAAYRHLKIRGSGELL